MIRTRILPFVVAFAVVLLVDCFVGFVASDVVAVAAGTATVVVIYVVLRNRQATRRARGRCGVSR